MSYNIARQVSPQVAILSFSSAGAGNVVFASFLTSSPVTSSATAATFYHIVDGVNGTSYSIVSTSFTSGLDQQIESIQSDATTTFSLNCNQATSSNSRLEIWRIPL